MFFHYAKIIMFGYGKETIILSAEPTGNKVTIVFLEKNGFLLVLGSCGKQRTPSAQHAMPRLEVDAVRASLLEYTEVHTGFP